jgi:hypothetical protein
MNTDLELTYETVTPEFQFFSVPHYWINYMSNVIEAKSLYSPNLVAALSLFKTWVCGRSLAGTAGSNTAGTVHVSCECCLLSGIGLCLGLIIRPEESTNCGVCVATKPRRWGGVSPLWLSSHEKQKETPLIRLISVTIFWYSISNTTVVYCLSVGHGIEPWCQ